MKTIISSCLFTMMILASAQLGAQQGQSFIRGRIVDSANKPISGFHLIARSESGEERRTVTDANGAFNVTGLRSGIYLLQSEVAAAGGATRTTVTVTADTTNNVSLQADASGNVQIVSETVVPSSASAAVHQEFSNDPIEKLPQANAISKDGELYGANNLSLLTESVSPGSLIQKGVGPSVAGRPNSSNSFEVRGTDNINPATFGPLVTISNEAVENLTVEQGDTASRQNQSTGGQVNSGITQATNAWHGSVYDYLNTRKLNAVEPSLAGGIRTQRYDQNRMGLSLGGPIVRNKLFSFVNFEYIPLRANRIQLGSVYAPTAAGYTAAATVPGVSATNLTALQNTVGVAPTGSFNAIVGGVAIPVGTINRDLPTSLDQFNGMANIDWQKGSTSRLSALYVHNDAGTNAFGSTLPAFAVPGHRRAMLGQLNYTGVLESGVTVNLFAGYNRLDQKIGGGDQVFPGAAAFPNIKIQDLGLQLGYTVPSNRTRSNMYQVGGWAEYAIASHRVRFGSDIRYLETIFENLATAPGNYDYSSLNRFLLDLSPDGGGMKTFNGSGYVGSRSIWNGFIQDRVRVHQVNVELGLAYQYAQLPLSVRRQSYLAGSSVPGLITFAEPKSDKNNFAPHIAIAWSPIAERTTIRSGFGMKYETLNGASTLLGPEMSVATVRNPTSTATGFLASGGLPQATSAAGGIGVYTMDTRTPYILHWNVGLTQALWGNFTAEARYVGNHGVHQPFESILNNPSVVSESNSLPVYVTNPGAALLNSLTLTQAALANQTNAYTAAGFANPILTQRAEGSSWYNAGILKLNNRFSGGSQLTGEYTYTDARSDATGTPLDLQFGHRLRMEQVPWARKHRATLTPVFDLGSIVHRDTGALAKVTNNLTIMATLTYESGALLPLFGGAGTGIMGTPEGSGVFINPSGIPGLSTSVTALTNASGQTVAFMAANPNAQYITGAPGTFSPLRPTLRLGETRNVDMAIVKRFAIGEWGGIETRADAFNLFNHPQFTGLPISMLGTGAGWNGVPSYLSVSNPQFNNLHGSLSGNPRVVQLALKLTF